MINIDKALDVPGWMTKQELTWLAQQASDKSCIVEIGSWRGRSTRALADNTKGVVFCIDSWSDEAIGYPGWWNEDGPRKEDPEKYKKKNWLWNEFQNNVGDLIGKRVIPIRMLSVDGFALLRSWMYQPDMIFIDGAHDFYHVHEDILLWRTLLKNGGVLCGHDYEDPTCPGVKKAVDALFPSIDIIETIWRAK
jgi:hypothetical protein